MVVMKTLDGERVNWASIMQERMLEEIEAKRKTKMMELYSTFYISVLCEELPPPTVFLGGPSSPQSSPSPSSNSEKPDQEVVVNRRLRLRVQSLQKMVDEKQDQLIKKGKALVECQTNNVKNICDLAQAMKERMSKEAEIETLRKIMETIKALGEEKEEENQALREQMQHGEQERAILQSCQE